MTPRGLFPGVRCPIIWRMGVRCFALVAVAGAFGALLVGTASSKSPRTVALSVNITGSGTVRVGSHVVSCAGMACHQTIRVRRGSRVVIRITPTAGWKLTASAGACKSVQGTCSIRPFVTAHIAVTFVPPGDRLNPIPLGTAAQLMGGWQLTVNSAVIDADSQVEAVTEFGQPANDPPSPGAQYTLVNISATYTAGGSGNFFYIADSLAVEGAHEASYLPTCTPPSPDLAYGDEYVFSGQSITGNLCYEIASNDASTLLLVGDALVGGSERGVWFAILHVGLEAGPMTGEGPYEDAAAFRRPSER
jgi:hypothetical protein